MQFIFITIALAGAGYFLFAKREFDILSVGYVSAFVYFSPGFTGEVMYPMEQSQVFGYPVPIHPETYLVMAFVLIALWGAAFIFDLPARRSVPNIPFRAHPSFLKYAIGYTYLGMIMTWITLGVDVMTSPDKNDILAVFSRWSILWGSGSVIAFVLAFEQRRTTLMLVAVIALLVDMYAGFRTSSAIAAISVACLWLNQQGAGRLAVRHWRILLLGAVMAAFLFIYKFLFSAIKAEDWGLVLELLANPTLYFNAFLNSEPFFTQSVLNEVIREDFQSGLGHFASTPLSFALFAPELGWVLPSFSDIIQSQLFPNLVETGVAANIWAEMISAGGWILLFIFVSLYALALCWGSYLIRASDPVWRSVIVSAFVVLAFYVHRNELQFQITLEKRTLLFFALCWISSRISLNFSFKTRLLRG